MTNTDKNDDDNAFAKPLAVSKGAQSAAVATTSHKPVDTLLTQPCPYEAPAWASQPSNTNPYTLEVLKEGSIVERIPLNTGKHGDGSFITIGRWNDCDVKLDHPSISRWHAVLQYGDDGTHSKSSNGMCGAEERAHVSAAPAAGWHLYDCGSTHGIICNKRSIPARQYVRLHVGYVVRFGLSTRHYIIEVRMHVPTLRHIQGPSNDIEPESSKSVTELRAERERHKLIAAGVINEDGDDGDADTLFRKARIARTGKAGTDDERPPAAPGEINWGIDDDKYDHDEESNAAGADAEDERDAYYLADPKKALTRYFEREGVEMKFDFEEKGGTANHKWLCKIELPSSQFAEATVSGSKKDAIVACALAACKQLDAFGMLRGQRAATESRHTARARALLDNDYMSSDEDAYFDRTDELDAKRMRRKRRIDSLLGVTKSGGARSTAGDRAMRYEHIAESEAQRDRLQQELDSIQHTSPAEANVSSASTEDALDAYMHEVKKADQSAVKGALDIKVRKSQLRQQLCVCQHEIDRLHRLAKVARPAELPKINKLTGKIVRDETANTSTKHDDVKPSGELKPTNADVSNKKSRATVAQLAEEFAREKQDATITIDGPPPEARVYSMEIPEHILQQDASTTIGDDEQNDDDVQFDDEQQTVDDKDESAARARRSRKRVRVRHRQTEQQIEDTATVERRADPIKFATWLPPAQQTGDGRTSLNDKLGY